ncbi:TetR/AcrR family transcriptional regulator [Mycobacterium sp. 48b]|uniref:TetR/AcrR family transcriptional regulator n=1 Tax=Mycobacterium sp. 48b TaxID=3400426 RepID=UPI003AAF0543
MTRRRVETRQRLLDAAFAVFAAKGFGRTRIDDICQASGYTKGAFYSNFKTLDELFLALYREQL